MSAILPCSCRNSYRQSSLVLRFSTATHRLCLASLLNTSAGRIAPSYSQLRTYSDTRKAPIKSPKSGDEIPKSAQKPKFLYRGPIGKIRWTIQIGKHKKWGFVFYRCDYSDDAAWNKFLANVRHNTESALKLVDAEDLLPSWDLTVKEDKKTLDKATVEQVRELFRLWVLSDEAKAEISDAVEKSSPRYGYCVHVDADAIDSVVRRAPQPPEEDFKEIGYATLVRHDSNYYLDGTQSPIGDMREKREALDADDEAHYLDRNDVKVPIGYLGPTSYSDLAFSSFSGRDKWNDSVRYVRDDGVSCGETPEILWGPDSGPDGRSVPP